MSVNRFSSGRGTHRILLAEYDGSDDWVDIRESLPWRDALALRSMGVTGMRQTGPGQVEYVLDAPRVRLELMARAIIAWSFTDGQNPVPVNRQTIEMLDSRLGDWLAEKIDAYYEKKE